MFWIVMAVAAHAGNALVFAIDKGILGAGSRVSSPGRYAALSGAAALPVAGVLLVVPYAPSGSVVGWSLAAGAAWVLALWCYFAALARGEATRIVPLTGAAVALVTLLLAAGVLREPLSFQQWLACGVLVAGSVVLSLRLREVRRLSGAALGLAIIAGGLFAGYFVIIKFLLDSSGVFWGPFAYARLAVGGWALLLWVMLGRRTAEPGRSTPVARTGRVAAAFVAGKGIALAALVAQHYAIALGSVAIVNALQGTQYIFLLGVAGLLSQWRPKILQEELGRVAVGQKLVGIVLIGLGLLGLV